MNGRAILSPLMVPRWYKPNSFENQIGGFESNPSTTVGWTFKHSPIKNLNHFGRSSDLLLQTFSCFIRANNSVLNIISFIFKNNSGTLVLLVMNLNVKGPIYANSPMFSNYYICLSVSSPEMRVVHSLLLLLAPQCAKTCSVWKWEKHTTFNWFVLSSSSWDLPTKYSRPAAIIYLQWLWNKPFDQLWTPEKRPAMLHVIMESIQHWLSTLLEENCLCLAGSISFIRALNYCWS